MSDPEGLRDTAMAEGPDSRPSYMRVSAATGKQRTPQEQKDVVSDAIPPEIFGSAAVAATEPSIYDRYKDKKEIPFGD